MIVLFLLLGIVLLIPPVTLPVTLFGTMSLSLADTGPNVEINMEMRQLLLCQLDDVSGCSTRSRVELFVRCSQI